MPGQWVGVAEARTPPSRQSDDPWLQQQQQQVQQVQVAIMANAQAWLVVVVVVATTVGIHGCNNKFMVQVYGSSRNHGQRASLAGGGGGGGDDGWHHSSPLVVVVAAKARLQVGVDAWAVAMAIVSSDAKVHCTCSTVPVWCE